MPTRVFYNTSPYGFQQQNSSPVTHQQPQTQPQPPITYFNNVYDHLAPQMQQHTHVHPYIVSYPNHHYSQQNPYRDPNHSYAYNNTNQSPYYRDQFQQHSPQQQSNIPFQNNAALYQNYQNYQMAMLQAHYYNQNYANQYYNNKTAAAYINVNHVPPGVVQPPTNPTSTAKIETMKPNKEVYHKIPEFKTIRKRMPTESRQSHREKPKISLERMRSQSAMASIGRLSDKNTIIDKKHTNLTKINELKEIKKKMEKLEEISARDTEERKKQKLDLLRKLRNKKNNDNFNIYINELPFLDEDKTKNLKTNKNPNSKIHNSDESGLGDIDKNSSSSSKCSQSDSTDSSANPEPQKTTIPSNVKKIIPIINHNNKPILPQVKTLAYKPVTSSKEIVQERKQSKSRINTDLIKPSDPLTHQEPSKLVIKQKFKFLGIFNANPEEYILQYGNELIPSIFNDKKSSIQTKSFSSGALDDYVNLNDLNLSNVLNHQ